MTGHFKVVEALAKNGASIDLTDKDGKLPIYIATERGVCFTFKYAP